MEKINANAAGIDIGSQKVFVGMEGKEVFSYGTFTSDFNELADFLISSGVDTVAMEATGVYWVTLYDILTGKGLDVWLVDGRQTKQVPGRKTDVKDCQWIQQLHSYGLLSRCFVAEDQLKELRCYQRMREDHIRSSAMHINQMQKALIEMNIRLPEVLSQVHGKSGLAIIQAILSGKRNREYLLSLSDKRIIKTKKEQMLKALEGYYTAAGLFALQQAYEAYCFYQKQIKACDEKLSYTLQRINPELPPDAGKLNRKAIRHNKPNIDHLGAHLIQIFGGRDATKISGITDYSWLQIYTETGNDLLRWPTENHLTSWLGLSPGQHHSGKMKRNKKKGRPKAGQIFRNIAQSLLTSKNVALGAFARRLRARKGPGIAIKATARKLAIQYWRLMVLGEDYVERGVAYYQETLKVQKAKYLNKLAVELDYEIVQKKYLS